MANAVIGALRVNLGLDSAKFHSGLRRGQSGMSAFAAKAKVAFAAAAAAFGVAVVAMAKNGLSFIDSQAKIARSIDGSIDALRALQIAAGDAGVDASALNKSMQMLGRGLSDAERKGGAAADALETIGLKASDLTKLDADERVAVIADRIKELGLSAQQTTSLLADLGIRNKEMALLLIQGGDAIRAARTEVDKLGLSISAVDAAKVEEANDAFSRISFATEALSNRLAVALAPALKAVADAFVAGMREGGALRVIVETLGENIGRMAAIAAAFASLMAGRFALAIGVAAVGAVTKLSLSLAGLRAAIARTGFGLLVIGAAELILAIGRLISRVGGFGEAFGLVKDVSIEVWERVRQGAFLLAEGIAGSAQAIQAAFTSAFAGIVRSFADMTAKMADTWNGFMKSVGVESNAVGFGAGFAESMDARAAHLKSSASAFNASLRRSVADLNAPLDSLARLRESGAETEVSIDGVTESVAELGEELESTGGSTGKGSKALDELSEKTKTLKERMSETKEIMRGAFVGLITGAKSLGETLKGLLASFAEMLANRAFERLWSGGLSGGNSGGGFLKNLFGGGGFLKGLLGFANGTPSAPGGLARINERGGEIINLPRGSQVIPHEMSKRMMGEGGGGPVEIILRSDPSVLVEIAQNESRAVVRQAAPGLTAQAVSQSQASFRNSKAGWSP